MKSPIRPKLAQAENLGRQLIYSYVEHGGPKQDNHLDPDKFPTKALRDVAEAVFYAMLEDGCTDFSGVRTALNDAPSHILAEFGECCDGFAPLPQDCGGIIEKLNEYHTELQHDILTQRLAKELADGQPTTETRRQLDELEAGGDIRAVDLTSFELTDYGNAQRVFSVAGSNFRYIADSGSWMIWNHGRWSIDGDREIVRLFINTMTETGKQAVMHHDRARCEPIVKFSMRCRDIARVQSGLEMLKSIRGVSVKSSDLDADPWLLGTSNETIDLRTAQPIAPNPSKLITKAAGSIFDASATCPTWEKFIFTATGGDMELAGFLQSAVGYTLTGSNIEQCLFFLHGKGSNGKGVFSETIKRLLGDYAQTAPESLFMKTRCQSASNDIARLVGCRMAIAAELEEDAAFAESRIKSLTGNDTITARFLHHEFFDFSPTHHLWISGNHKPSVRGADLGIWRRIRLIPFTVKIEDRDKDLNLLEKLVGELPGILNWALAGCIRWQTEGLKVPSCVSRATEDYRKEEDVIGQFIDECTVPSPADRIPTQALYQAYESWAELGGIKHKLTARAFNKKLDEREMKQTKSNGGRFWAGITTI